MDDDQEPLLPPNEEPSEELERLARETLEAQSGTADPVGARRRCQRVIDLYAQGKIVDARYQFHAAWVRLCGETQGHYSMARMFARRATEMGEERGWTLRAMAWDRWLVAGSKPQRFGTQIIKQHGHWSLGAVEDGVSDFERAFYAVPPLYVQRQRAEQLEQQERTEEGGEL